MNQTKVAFLPIWGKLNETIPQQQMAAIREMGGEASYGVPGTFFPLTRTIRRYHPNVISLDWIHQYALAPGLFQSLIKSFLFVLDVWIARILFRVKLVWTFHNLQHHDPRPRKLERWVSSFFAKNCVKVRILGDGVQEIVSSYLRIPEEKLVVIPEGPYIGWYPEGESRASAREKLQLATNDKVWLYLGTLRPYKGVESLIEVYHSLKAPDLKLVVAGNPWNKEYADSLISLAKGNPGIKIHAFSVPDDDLQTYFAASDLVILPFKQVLNSGSVLLAMGFGKPVVAPRIGLIPFRLCKQPELLFDEQNPLDKVLRNCLAMSNHRLESMGKENRFEALRYSWKDFAGFVVKEV